MGQWMMLVLSRRYSILPALDSLTACGHVGGHGAGLGGGHQALGAEDLAETADNAHHVGAGDDDVEIEPVLALDLLRPAPCRRRNPRRLPCSSSSRSRLGRTRGRVTLLPVPLGRTMAPRTCWSAWRESTPSFTCSSTVSSNFALAVLATQLHSLSGLILGGSVDELRALVIIFTV